MLQNAIRKQANENMDKHQPTYAIINICKAPIVSMS